jgi:GAF domain-containing protein
MLLEAMEAVARSKNLSQGLHSLAEKMVAACEATFCQILLKEAQDGNWLVQAACHIPREAGLDWQPGVGKMVRDLEIAGFASLSGSSPTVIHPGSGHSRAILETLAGEAGLAGLLKSVLVVPLKNEEKTIGLCILGEMRSWERSPFTEMKIELTRSLAAQAAAFIEKMELHELTQRRLEEITRRERQLTILHKLSDYIQAAGDLDKILRVVLTGITAGYGLGFNRAALFLLDEENKPWKAGWASVT